MDLLFLVALLPVILALILLVIFVLPAIRVMPVIWAFTLLIAALVWRMPPNALIAANIKGLEGAFEIVLIIFGALLLLCVLEDSGALSAITRNLASISEDSRVQAVIVGFLFVSLLESCAGFGVPAAICASMLYMLGFPPVAAVVVSLIGDMASVTFGGLGVPILVSYGKTLDIPEVISSLPYGIDQMLINVSFWSATFHALVGSFIPFMICLVLTRFWGNKSARDAFGVWKFCLFVSATFFVPYWLFSLLGPELPTIGASMVSLPLVIYTSSKGFLMPKKTWKLGEKRGGDTAIKDVSTLKAWSPYALVVAVLILTRIPAIYDVLSSLTLSWNNALSSGISIAISPLTIPGVIPLIPVALMLIPIYGIERKDVKKIFLTAAKRTAPTSVVLIFSVTMAMLMVNSFINVSGYDGMLVVLAKALASLFGRTWGFISPFIGALGSFITGSNTTSDMTFGLLQWTAAQQIGISGEIALALQAVGGSLGVTICVAKVITACATVGMVGKEGEVIRKTLWPTLLYCTAVGLLGLAFTLLL